MPTENITKGEKAQYGGKHGKNTQALLGVFSAVLAVSLVTVGFASVTASEAHSYSSTAKTKR